MKELILIRLPMKDITYSMDKTRYFTAENVINVHSVKTYHATIFPPREQEMREG